MGGCSEGLFYIRTNKRIHLYLHVGLRPKLNAHVSECNTDGFHTTVKFKFIARIIEKMKLKTNIEENDDCAKANKILW